MSSNHKFVILIGRTLYAYTNYDDIPMEFDNVIEFRPVIPDAPHSHDDHDEIEQWNDRLKELMRREKR
jgi:hypothetical protein